MYNDTGDLDSETVVGGFKTDTLSPGTFRAGLGASVYDYDLTDGTAHVMQYGYSAYAQHADHFVYDVDLEMDTRAYTVENDGTREEVLFNIVDTSEYDMNGRVVTPTEVTSYFGRQVDTGNFVQERSLSMDTDGLTYRSDNGKILFSQFPTSTNTTNAADLTYQSAGGLTTQQKLYFDYDNQAFRAGSVASTAWNPGVNVGTGSMALGFAQNTTFDGSIASGNYSIALGQANVTSGVRSMAFGTGLTAPSDAETALGIYSTTYTPAVDPGDRLFTIGNGSSSVARSDAFTILKNGDVGVALDNFETVTNGSPFQIGDGTSIIAYLDGGTGNWVAVSDERQKNNIQDLSYGLQEILRIRPVSFDYKRNGEHTIGLLAQQVSPIIPESVYGSDEKGFGMSYQTLVPVTIKAIQELNMKVESVQAQITAGHGTSLTGWLADQANGITSIIAEKVFGKEIHASEKVCIQDTCLSQAELQQLLQMVGHNGGGLTTGGAPTPEEPQPHQSDEGDTETATPEIVDNTPTVPETETNLESSEATENPELSESTQAIE